MRPTRETPTLDPTGHMPQDNDQKPARTLGLSPAQIAGSALSAVSAAFVASWAGTTGTLIGAAVGSVALPGGGSLLRTTTAMNSVRATSAAAAACSARGDRNRDMAGAGGDSARRRHR